MDYKNKIEQTVTWTKETVVKSGLSRAVIGLSGGVDSAVSATILVKAIGVENVYAALFPYGDLHSHGIDDAKLLLESLHIPDDHIFVIDIKNSVDEILKNVILEGDRLSDRPIGSDQRDSIASLQNDMHYMVRMGNVMARVRMIYLFDLAKKLGGLVCGTENKTEHLLGYYTRFGDEASDIEPIRNLYKTDVWEIAKILGVPEQIITKAPTAGLWEGQTDENELGFSYAQADTVLQLHFDEGLSRDEIVEKGIALEIVEKVLERVSSNDFKHKLPYVNK